MELDYDIATDSLYIRLAHTPYLESEEVSLGIILDFADDGTLRGIEIDSVDFNATPAKLQDCLRNLPEDLTLDERQQVSQAFDLVMAGNHKQLDPIV
jgi:uncharacterized protein YuzE